MSDQFNKNPRNCEEVCEQHDFCSHSSETYERGGSICSPSTVDIHRSSNQQSVLTSWVRPSSPPRERWISRLRPFCCCTVNGMDEGGSKTFKPVTSRHYMFIGPAETRGILDAVRQRGSVARVH